MITDDQPAMERHPNHVLVIEDEESHAELIRRGFKSNQQDFHLTFAGSVLDARNRINKNPPDLIIADWLLPDGKGIEILPADREAITIPVIIMTSHGNEELAVEMLKAGVVDYIVKSESSFKELPHIAERALRDWDNIVQRKRAEEALRESEAKYRLIADNTADSIWIFDMDMHLQYISPSVEKIKGFTVEEALSQSLEEAMTPESLESLMKRFHQEMVLEASGTADPDRTVSFETEEYCKSGATILVENSVTLLRDAQGRPVRMLGISRDITERKRVEEALQESEAKYRTIFENTGTAMVIVEESTIISLANKEFAQLTGFSKDDIEGKKSWTEFVVKEDLERMLAQHRLRRQNREKALTYYEFRAVTKSGDIRTIYLSIDMIPGTTKSVASLLDITERKRAEEALHESEERYRLLTDAAHDAIFTLSPEGVVTYVNSGGSVLIGMPPEKIVGLPLESLYHPDIAQELRENLDKVISTKRPVRFDAKFWHENQDRLTWQDAQLVPQLGPDGSVVQVIGISRSITDRKQAEMLLKRFNVELEWQVRLRTAELEHTNTLLEGEIIQRTQAEESVRKSLNERELLLREIHHRVKNNLQVILSLISLQSRNIKDQKLLDTMGEFQNRIMAMAHVHERMCRAEDISRIDLSEIVTFLGTSLFKSYKVNRQHIRLNVEIKDLYITIRLCNPHQPYYQRTHFKLNKARVSQRASGGDHHCRTPGS